LQVQCAGISLQPSQRVMLCTGSEPHVLMDVFPPHLLHFGPLLLATFVSLSSHPSLISVGMSADGYGVAPQSGAICPPLPVTDASLSSELQLNGNGCGTGV
jgi:hypothetical protein